MKNKIFLSFIVTALYSGQCAASALLESLLTKSGWTCRIIPLYPYIRGKSTKFRAVFNFIVNQFRTLKSLISLFFSSGVFLYINLGQSIASFVRVGIWFLPFKILHPYSKVIISLHGSIFMTWSKSNYKTLFFLFLLKRANIVTVLGDRQKKKLIELGLAESNIQVVPNTFDLKANQEPDYNKKFLGEGPIRILHLSLLIESKGFPEYLEALKLISRSNSDVAIEAVLCGPVAFTGYCTRFIDASQKTAWIDNILNEINKSKNVKIQWIKGASGEEKDKLFRDAEIFVFPSSFPVEAQPLVLLEAMASGCSIITTNVGEITSTVDNSCAIILDNVTTEKVAESILKLCFDAQLRRNMGIEGYKKVKTFFSAEVYLSNWIKILNTLKNQK